MLQQLYRRLLLLQQVQQREVDTAASLNGAGSLLRSRRCVIYLCTGFLHRLRVADTLVYCTGMITFIHLFAPHRTEVWVAQDSSTGDPAAKGPCIGHAVLAENC